MVQRGGLTSTAGTSPLPRVRERYEISGGRYALANLREPINSMLASRTDWIIFGYGPTMVTATAARPPLARANMVHTCNGVDDQLG